MVAASSGVWLFDAVLLGWPLARLALVRFGPRALDSVRKICKEIREEKIFKIFSKNGESGLRGG